MRLRARVLVASAALFMLLAVLGAAHAASLTRAETQLLSIVNRVRATRGLKPLRVDWTLEAAARAHSADMLHSNVFAHGDVLSRLRAFGAAGPVYGENLAWGTGTDGNPGTIVREWLASPEHRANLLRPGFRRIGIAAAAGRFAGWSGALVVTADFGGH